MKMIRFINSALTLACTAILAVLSLVICVIGFTTDLYHDINLGSLMAFDIVFWISCILLIPIVISCWNEYQEGVTNNPENYIE